MQSRLSRSLRSSRRAGKGLPGPATVTTAPRLLARRRETGSVTTFRATAECSSGRHCSTCGPRRFLLYGKVFTSRTVLIHRRGTLAQYRSEGYDVVVVAAGEPFHSVTQRCRPSPTGVLHGPRLHDSGWSASLQAIPPERAAAPVFTSYPTRSRARSAARLLLPSTRPVGRCGRFRRDP